MRNLDEAKSILSQYVNSFGGPQQAQCNLCCASNGGGKAKYQDFIDKNEK